ncbi:MAG: hypothetical protein JWM59_3966 [Verrucomicrobiales bacterium]|nr:hypothetical protein [Verrucomicrobiales bacterium]
MVENRLKTRRAMTLPRFMETCTRAGIPKKEAAPMGADLLERYAAPERYYHNLAHIGKMLDGLEATGAGTPERELAIWFHDCVYEPMGKGE